MSEVFLSAIALGTGGFVVNGQGASDMSGRSVSSAGDVNGDGFIDLIIGADRSDPAGLVDAGRSYVVFGHTGTDPVDLAAVAAGTGGFVINGQGASDRSGAEVAAAGDVNGDGLADLIIGAYDSDPASGSNAGRSYVVFGTSATAPIELSAIAAGSGGFVINGQSADDCSGASVAGAGDVNGDGLSDLIVGAYGADPASGQSAGRSYVVFGQTGTTAINLSAIAAGSGGFVINGQCTGDDSGEAVAGAGDVNGDGLADLIIGAYRSALPAGTATGRAYVVFGRAEGGAVQLSAVAAGIGGFLINGECSYDYTGDSLARAGDVNGDGLADIIVAQTHGDPGGRTDAGRTYVIFGTAGTGAVALSDVANGTGGFVINGQCAGDVSGVSVDGAGDVNGDGLADLIVGAFFASVPGAEFAGRSYVVFGQTGTAAVELSAVAAGSGGFVINGAGGSDFSGRGVAGAGDVNGDGLADLVVGANFGDPPGRTSAGLSYVIFGSSTGAFAETAVDLLGGSGDDLFPGTAAAETLVGGAGNDTLGGNGGADVLYGGTGDDNFVLTGSFLAALSAGFGAGGNDSQLARVDGGSGLDTLVFDGTGIALDLTAIPNQGAGTPGSSSRLESIERIDLTGGGNNSVTLTAQDVADLAGMNLVNSVTQGALGWTNVTYTFAAQEARHQLIITGNAGDDVHLGGIGWTARGTVTFDGDTYRVYDSVRGSAQAQVLVADAVTRDVTEPGMELSSVAGGDGGFVINGQCERDYSGFSVSSAGDVNGDGLADLIVGAPQGDPATGSDAGRSYVVFGTTGSGPIHLSDVAAGTGGFVIDGSCADDLSGMSVAGAGDVNGDGIADLIVGAYGSELLEGVNAGRAYVVFGTTGTAPIELSAIAGGTGGFVINGESTASGIAAAGDVNGDGLADLLVGAPGDDGSAGHNPGRSYVVFGRTGTTAVDLSAVEAGSGGFIIHGQCAGDYSGWTVSGAGDVNGDGLADVIVGAYRSDPFNYGYAGRTYIVFGRTGTGAIELSAIAAGTGGFVINGQCEGDQSGRSAAGAGDVNGDGLADLIVGAPASDPAAGGNAGRSYLVFGRTGTAAVNLSAVAAGSGGFVINGQYGSDRSGVSVSGAGDLNGDGLADVIIGADRSEPLAGHFAGRSYVVFGGTGTGPVELSAVALGSGGFVINGDLERSYSGRSVAGAADVNGDGLADLIVGAQYAHTQAALYAGRSYVVFGTSSGEFYPTAVDHLGGDGDDPLDGTAGADTLAGGAGDDTLTGNGGADVLLGGAGDDRIVLDASNVAALSAGFGAGGNGSQLARVDGGTGLDTLALSGSGIHLDLRAIANQGGGTPGSASRLESVERVDLAGSGGSTVTLAARDVADLAGANLINSATRTALGWTDGSNDGGTYTFAEFERRHQLIVEGDDAGTARLGGGTWTRMGTVTYDGDSYTVYDSDTGLAQVIASDALVRDVQAPIALADIAGGTGGFVVNGQASADRSGYSVASAGDVNGDGLTDVIVGARASDPLSGNAAGRSYIVFGHAGTAPVNLAAIAGGTGGFVVNGQCGTDFSGSSVAGAGDVNGDGLADVIIGAYYGDPAAGTSAGRSYVVFGKNGTGAVELAAVAAGSGGFVVNGQCAGDYSGISVAAAGDVNGDGLADVIVGASGGDPAASDRAGRSYVVFGHSGGGLVNLASVAAGSGGFVINGQCASDTSGRSVAGAGDVNGDGLADVVVGAPAGDPAGEGNAGRSYVVFGRTGTAPVSLAAIAAGTGGFVVNGQCTNDYSGASVAGAGDVNGDGLADLIVGAKGADPAGGGTDAGRSYVVFGRTGTSPVALSNVEAGAGGFVINGQGESDQSGISVAGAGDVNGDGLADLIVGANLGDSAPGDDAGRSYVVFGRTAGGAVELSAVAVGTGGFVINGLSAGENSGISVSAAGDVNGDGLADLVVGANLSDPTTGNNAGRSYVIFGATGGAFLSVVVDRLGGSGNEALAGTAAAETIVGGAGNDTLTGNGGADVLYGGAGNDNMVVNAGNIAALVANSGAGGNAGRLARVDGGGGTDTLTLSGSGIALNLSAVDAQGAGTPGSASRVEGIERINLTGSGSNTLALTPGDILDLSDSTNTLRVDGNAGDGVTLSNAGGAAASLSGSYHRFTKGGAILEVNTLIAVTLRGSDSLADVLTGTSAADTLLGLAGNDTLDGRAGNDALNGGAGTDTASYAAAAAAVTVNLALAAAQNTGGAGSDTLTAIESVTGSAFNDTLTGNTGANALSGGNGNDTLTGGLGNDALNGGAGTDTASYASAASAVTLNLALAAAQNTHGAGSDTLTAVENATGSAFNDTLTGNTGANALSGGNGNDTLSGGAGNDSLNGGAGTDTASYATAIAAVNVNLALVTAQNTSGAGTDTLTAIENLTGGAGNDTLTGNGVANTLSGGAGNDALLGGNGADILRGQAGVDTMTGGLGADQFDFDAVTETGITAPTRDIIVDFVHAQADKIDLSGIDANASASGNQAFNFIGTAAFSGNSTGKLRFDAVNHVLLGSTDADTAAEFSIQVNGIGSMVAGDFIL